MSDPRLRDHREWDDQWSRWFAIYSAGRPRLGSWLAARYDLKGRDVLELGAGSGRESRAIAPVVRRTVCVDFSEVAIERLRRSQPPANLVALRGDARKLAFFDGEFDLSFHKGFWACFGHDSDLDALIDEQMRVTRGTALAIVHNARNTEMVRLFAERGRSDVLYKVRFFEVEELVALAERAVARSGRPATIEVHRFGGPTWMHRPAGRALPMSVQGRLANLAYRFTPLDRAESLVLEVRLAPAPDR